MKIKKICELFAIIFLFYLILKLISDVCFKKKTYEYFGSCDGTQEASGEECSAGFNIDDYQNAQEAEDACNNISGCTFTPETPEPSAEPSAEPTETPEPSAEPTETPEPTAEPPAEPAAEPAAEPPAAEPAEEPQEVSGVCSHPTSNTGYVIDYDNSSLERNDFNIIVTCDTNNGYVGSPTVTQCSGENQPYTLSGCSEQDTTGKCSNVDCQWPLQQIENASSVNGSGVEQCCEKRGLCIGNNITDDDHQCAEGTWHRYNAAVWPRPCPDDNSITFPQCYNPVRDVNNPLVYLEPSLENISRAYSDAVDGLDQVRAKNEICCVDGRQHNFIERIYGSQINIGRALDLENEIKLNTSLTDEEKINIKNELLGILYDGRKIHLDRESDNETIKELISIIEPLEGMTLDSFGTGFCKGNLDPNEDIRCSDEVPLVRRPFITEGTTTEQCCRISGKCHGNTDESEDIVCPEGSRMKEDTSDLVLQQDINERNCCDRLRTCSSNVLESDDIECSVNKELKVNSRNITIEESNCSGFSSDDQSSCPNECVFTAGTEDTCSNSNGEDSDCELIEDECNAIDGTEAECSKNDGSSATCIQNLESECCEQMKKCSNNIDSEDNHECNIGTLRDDSSSIFISNLLDETGVDNMCCVLSVDTQEIIPEEETVVSAELAVELPQEEAQEILDQDSEASRQWQQNFINDIATILGVDPSRIMIDNISEVEPFIIEGLSGGISLNVDWSYKPEPEDKNIVEPSSIQRAFSMPGIELPSTGISTASAVKAVEVKSKSSSSGYIYILLLLIVVIVIMMFFFGFGAGLIGK